LDGARAGDSSACLARETESPKITCAGTVTAVAGTTAPSILAFIRRHLAEGADLGGVVLPDERQDAGRVRFAPGAWDGIATHHVAAGSDDPAAALVAAVRGACDTRRGFAGTVSREPEPATADGRPGVWTGHRRRAHVVAALKAFGRGPNACAACELPVDVQRVPTSVGRALSWSGS
jgi:hypothetical protein